MDAGTNCFPEVQENTHTIAEIQWKGDAGGRGPAICPPHAVVREHEPHAEGQLSMGTHHHHQHDAVVEGKQVYTLFFKVIFDDVAPDPILRMSRDKQIYTFGHPLFKRPDGMYKVNFFIPEDTLAGTAPVCKRKVELD